MGKKVRQLGLGMVFPSNEVNNRTFLSFYAASYTPNASSCSTTSENFVIFSCFSVQTNLINVVTVSGLSYNFYETMMKWSIRA